MATRLAEMQFFIEIHRKIIQVSHKFFACLHLSAIL